MCDGGDAGWWWAHDLLLRLDHIEQQPLLLRLELNDLPLRAHGLALERLELLDELRLHQKVIVDEKLLTRLVLC